MIFWKEHFPFSHTIIYRLDQVSICDNITFPQIWNEVPEWVLFFSGTFPRSKIGILVSFSRFQVLCCSLIFLPRFQILFRYIIFLFVYQYTVSVCHPLVAHTCCAIKERGRMYYWTKSVGSISFTVC